jgi:hypothetical protein
MSESQSYFDRMHRGELAPPPVLTLLGSVIREVDAEAGQLRTDYAAAHSFLNPADGVQGGMHCAMLDDLTASLVDATRCRIGGQPHRVLILNTGTGRTVTSACSVLELLSQPPDAELQAAQRFRQHNLNLFEKMYPHRKNREKVIAVARDGCNSKLR